MGKRGKRSSQSWPWWALVPEELTASRSCRGHVLARGGWGGGTVEAEAPYSHFKKRS